jgi:hypothetical protein
VPVVFQTVERARVRLWGEAPAGTAVPAAGD